MMADWTKCFFQISVPAEQRDLFRILWFDKNDIREGNVVTYRFTRHPWGVKSSPLAGQVVSLLKSDSPEDLTDAIERCTWRSSGQPKQWIRELRSLDRFHALIAMR